MENMEKEVLLDGIIIIIITYIAKAAVTMNLHSTFTALF